MGWVRDRCRRTMFVNVEATDMGSSKGGAGQMEVDSGQRCASGFDPCCCGTVVSALDAGSESPYSDRRAASGGGRGGMQGFRDRVLRDAGLEKPYSLDAYFASFGNAWATKTMAETSQTSLLQKVEK